MNTIEEIWYGTKTIREPIHNIPFLGDFKIYYNLVCKEVGNVIIGIFVDDRLVQLYETKVTPKFIDNEMVFWFQYPLRFKFEGKHTILFALGQQSQLSDKTKRRDIEWIEESRPFNVVVSK